jgi:hypothetical protein
MSGSPIDVVSEWLQNALDENIVHRRATPDATFVSLHTDNAELNLIEPWTGISFGPQAFLDNLGMMSSRWENQVVNVTTIFAPEENVAVFGDFRYKSLSLNQTLTSPFSVHAKVVNGQITYVQFQQDTYAIAASVRRKGLWTIQTEPDAAPFLVRTQARVE